MTLEEIKKMDTEVISAETAAKVLHTAKRNIMKSAKGSKEERNRLGFNVIVTMSGRVLIPRRGFIEFMEGKQNDE